MEGENKQDLFFVRRNTNRNEVHYAITIPGEEHASLGPHPINGYWQMHEKGPGETEPITIFEQMAFGIKSQHTDAKTVLLRLNALPERTIRVEPDAATPGRFKCFTTIAGSEAELVSFYAHAEPALFLPKVKYIEIHGTVDGKPVTERINY